MSELKNHGDLQTAQVTTTKRSGAAKEKIFCWHGTIEEAFHELDCINSWHANWEGIKNFNKIDIFGGNMDETNISAAEGLLLPCGMLSDIFILCIWNDNHVLFWYTLLSISGATKVVASKYVKKHQMNKDENRGTIIFF